MRASSAELARLDREREQRAGLRSSGLNTPRKPAAPTSRQACVDKPVHRPQPVAPAAPSSPGPISAARIATAATRRRRFARAGRAKGFAGCGSSRSAAATRRLSSPMAARSPSSSGAIRKSSRPTTCRRAASSGPTRWNANFEESMGGDGPRATPTYHEGRVYALGAEGELRVLDAAKGTLVWRRNILTDNGAHNLSWGMSASPLIVDDKVIVLPGGTRGRSVVAYNKTTGDARLEGAERRSIVHLADARHARRRPPDPRRHGDARRRPDARQRHAPVGIPLEHVQRHQRRAADPSSRTTDAIAFSCRRATVTARPCSS